LAAELATVVQEVQAVVEAERLQVVKEITAALMVNMAAAVVEVLVQ
jgi:hypothetical protein